MASTLRASGQVAARRVADAERPRVVAEGGATASSRGRAPHVHDAPGPLHVCNNTTTHIYMLGDIYTIYGHSGVVLKNIQ